MINNSLQKIIDLKVKQGIVPSLTYVNDIMDGFIENMNDLFIAPEGLKRIKIKEEDLLQLKLSRKDIELCLNKHPSFNKTLSKIQLDIKKSMVSFISQEIINNIEDLICEFEEEKNRSKILKDRILLAKSANKKLAKAKLTLAEKNVLGIK